MAALGWVGRLLVVALLVAGVLASHEEHESRRFWVEPARRVVLVTGSAGLMG